MGKPSLWVRFFNAIFFIIYKGRYLILLFYVGAFVGGLFGASAFTKSTSIQFDPPPGTPSHIAQKAFLKYFPSKHHDSSLVVFIHNHHNQSVLTDQTRNLTLQLNESIRHDSTFQGILGYYLVDDPTSFLGELLARQFVRGFNDSSTVILIQFAGANPPKRGFPMVDLINDIIKRTPKAHKDDMVGLIGRDSIIRESKKGGSQLFAIESVVAPFALVVLGCVLRSWRLMIVPICCVLTSILVSMTLALPITKCFVVGTFVPALMMSAVVAMSIDYSLFLLTRFREEMVQQRRNHYYACKLMLLHGGRTVAVSGCTLAITFLALFAFPIDLIRTLGFGCGVAILTSIFISLTMTPALLLSFPRFFCSFALCPSCCYVCCSNPRCPCYRPPPVDINRDGEVGEAPLAKDDESLNVGSPLLQPTQPTGHTHSQGSHGHTHSQGSHGHTHSQGSHGHGHGVSERALSPCANAPCCNEHQCICMRCQCCRETQDPLERQRKSFWFRSGRFSTQKRWAVVLLIIFIVCAVPVAIHVKDLRVTLNNWQFLPHTLYSVKIYKEMKSVFSAGMMAPYKLICTIPKPMEGHGVQSVLSQGFFEVSRSLIYDIVQADNKTCHASNFMGISLLGGVPIDFTLAQSCHNTTGPLYTETICSLYRGLFTSWTNRNHTASVFTVTPPIDPYGRQVQYWVPKVRQVLQRYNQHDALSHGARFHLTGAATPQVDAQTRVMALFPLVVGGTCLVICIMIGLVFRSIFWPIRSILTIGITLTFIYGASVLVFQKHIFDWLFPTLKDIECLMWFTPIFSFSILVGLGLDYDIFLSSRIAEYRRKGYTHRASIIRGIYKTGGIITAAGLIMIVAFFGLMLCVTQILNEFGFMLVFAIAVDTFLVRTLLVPSILTLVGDKINWFPGILKMPRPTKDEFVLDEANIEAPGIIPDDEVPEALDHGVLPTAEPQAQTQEDKGE